MSFVADLHIHSRFSRATSRDLDLPHLHAAAQRKGIHVVGTGDFTHPKWREELREQLVPAEPGLFRLREELARSQRDDVPRACSSPVRFLLSCEISNIYKRDGKVRKVHNLLLAPSLEGVSRISDALERIGNLRSDGRPILGLDSRDLLEIVLEHGDGAVLVPAHIWTPWFAVLGSKSGFDSIEACYDDLAGHIFAVETGLSSDPPMNWRISALDRFTLVSNSDAHSPGKLAREANLFSCDLSFPAMMEALRTREGFEGTLEFYPEEGKYHLDGHRACEVRLQPEETAVYGGLCPSCGKPVTVGVLHRVERLADRLPGERPATAGHFESLVPLDEVVGEVLGVGPATKSVRRVVDRLLSALGNELHVLREAPMEDVERASSPPVAEAVRRARDGEVHVRAGYDGEFGTVRIFRDEERPALSGQRALFAPPREPAASPESAPPEPTPPEPAPPDPVTEVVVSGTPEVSTAPPEPVPEPTPLGQLDLFAPSDPAAALLDGLNDAQRAAVEAPPGPQLIDAGPGTGKTRTLTYRIAVRVLRGELDPAAVLAITFTNKAAEEMAGRLLALLGPVRASALTVCTFHALGLRLLRDEHAAAGLPPTPAVLGDEERAALLDTLDEGLLPSGKRARAQLLERFSQTKQTLAEPPDLAAEDAAALTAYEAALAGAGAVDLDDLVLRAARLTRDDDGVRERARARWRALFVDEYQDVNPVQAEWVSALASDDHDVTAIGDPNQAIYGFRGADVALFHAFSASYAGCRVHRLTRCYRSSETILAPARRLLETASAAGEDRLWSSVPGTVAVRFVETATERAEAETVVHQIEQLVGGTGFFSLDSARVGVGEVYGELGFGDIAVLYRTRAQAPALVEAFARSGVPFQTVGEVGPFAREELRAALNVLRLLVDPTNALAAGALPSCGPLQQRRRDRALAQLRSVAATSAPRAVVDALAEADLSLSLDAEALRPLALVADGTQGGLAELVARATLRTEQDAWDPRAERVALLTLHASKGLEFPVVFVVGCEDGLVPHARPGEPLTPEQRDEERRLLYVGMTRAGRQLTLLHARSRLRFGERAERQPSPFLAELEDTLLERERAGGEPRQKPAPDRQLTLL